MDITRRSAMAALAVAGVAGCRAAPQQVAGPGEGYTEAPGGKVWWKRVGRGEKTPILTLHGGPGAGHNYMLPLQALAADRQVIFYDQLGCGKADSPADEKVYTIQRSVDELDAVRKALGLEKVILVGHSWGAMLAIEYLCQGRGAGVEKLVLSGGLASVPQAVAGIRRLLDQLPDGKGKRLRELEEAGQTTTPEYQQILELFYATHLCRVNPPPPEFLASMDVLSKSIAYRVMNGPNEITVTGVIKDWERRPDLGKITVPTLITTGQFDEITLDCQETIRDGVKGSRLEMMPGCSHMTMNEKPAEYVALLRSFV